MKNLEALTKEALELPLDQRTQLVERIIDSFDELSNAEIDRLWNIGETTTDLQARKDAYAQLAYIWAEQAPFVYTHRPLSLTAIRQEFGNYKAQQGSFDTRAVLDRIFVR